MADRPAEHEADRLAEEGYDTADPAAVKRAEKKAAARERVRLAFVAKMMADTGGRAWLYHHIEMCNIFRTTFSAGDPHDTSFREGNRNAGLRLLADVMIAAPDLYVTMVREAKAAE